MELLNHGLPLKRIDYNSKLLIISLHPTSFLGPIKFKIPLSLPVIIITAALLVGPMTGYGADPVPKSVIAESATSPVTSENISSLIKEMGDKEYSVRSKSLDSLCKIGSPAVPAIIQALTDNNSYVRKGAAEALGNIGITSQDVISALIKTLIDSDSYVRKSAAESLSKIGASAVPSIIKALTDSDSYVRRGAADALGSIGPVTPEVVPALIRALEDRDSRVRRSAIEALGRTGSASPDVIHALEKVAGDSDSNVRKEVIGILEKRGGMTPELKVKCYVLDMGDSNSDVRKNAIDGLNKLGPASPDVMRAVMAALGDSDYSVRKSSAEFLDKRGAMTPALNVKRQIIDLKHGNKAVRIKAVESLGKIGAVTPEVIPALIIALDDRDTHDTAIEALGNIGPDAKDAVPSLIKGLTNNDSSVRAEAAEAIGKIGVPTAGAVTSLEKVLEDRDSTARAKAAEALKKLNGMTVKNELIYFTSSHHFISAFAGIGVCLLILYAIWNLIPLLWRFIFPTGWHIREFRNPDIKRRTSAVQAIVKIGKPAIPFLIKALKHRNSDVRINAADSLNKIGNIPPKSIPLIIKSLKDRESEVRKNITEILGKTEPVAKELIPPLIKMVSDSDSQVRASAAEALGKVGADVPEVVPALVKALGDSYYCVRDNAAEALEKCGTMPVALKVKRCIIDLGDSNGDISSRAVEELNKIGKTAIPELIKALGDANSHVRRFAASVLEKNNALTEELKVKRYIIDLGDSNTSVRTRAEEALGNIGPAAAEAIPHITKLIGSNDYYVRLQAAEALEKLGAITPELKMKKYILDLGDSSADVRYKAAEALCIFGPEADEALPKLQKLLTDEDEIVRFAAKRAIGKIGNLPDSTDI